MMNLPGQQRALIGRVLLSSALIMAAVAAAFWFRWFPINEDARVIASGAILIAAIADAVIALRLLGERG